jgi:hypothetical protein
MKALLALLRGRRRRRKAGSIDSEQFLRVYRETHRQVEDLRRAA